MGTSKNSPYYLSVIPAKVGIYKINYMDSPIKSGHDKKMNN